MASLDVGRGGAEAEMVENRARFAARVAGDYESDGEEEDEERFHWFIWLICFIWNFYLDIEWNLTNSCDCMRCLYFDFIEVDII